MNDADDLLAAEFALGLLDPTEAATAQDRARTDAAFSLRITWWRDQFAPLAIETETPPPAGIWPRIERLLPGNDNSRGIVQRWRAAALASMSVAAGLLAFIALRPGPTPAPMATPSPSTIPESRAPMMAALSGENGALVAVSYDAASGKMTIAPSVLDAGTGDAELWIIPAGGAAISMGVVSAKIPQTHNVPVQQRPLMQPGATFAITQEVKGGSPTGSAQGPIVASGKIISS
jgi:anti-sigma-K factor RskA